MELRLLWSNKTLFFTGQPRYIVDLAEKHKLPAIYPFRTYVEAGGLMSYGADMAQLFEHAADYVSRILNGAKPNGLPIERPSRVYLALNVKRAGELGIKLNLNSYGLISASSGA